MKKLPQEIVDDLMNDQDFLGLDDASQDEILGQIQKKLGISEPSENVLQKAAKAGGVAIQAGMQNMSPLGVSVNPKFPFLPQMPTDSPAMQAGLEELGPGVSIGSNLAAGLMMGAPKTKEIGGLLGEGISKISPQPLKNVLTKGGRLSYMDKMEGAIYKARSSASPRFKAALDEIASKNPGKGVDLSDFLSNLSNNMDESVNRIINQTPELQEILTKPGEVTIHEAQKALNALTSKISSSKLGGSAVRSSDIPVLDLVDDLKMSMSKSFPEIQEARSAYGNIVNNFRKVRGKLRGDAAAKNLFADYNPLNPRGKEFMGGERSEQAFKELVPENVFKEAINTRRVKTVKDVGQVAATGGLLEAIRRKVF